MHFSPIREISDAPSLHLASPPIAVRDRKPVRVRTYLSKIVRCIRELEYHGLKEHFQFIVAAICQRDVFLKLTEPDVGGALARLVADRPRYFSLMIAPYMDARWSSAERVDRLIEHAAALQGPLRKYDFSVFQSLYLLDLGEIGIPGYSVIIDKPVWLCHEGLVTLNLCKNGFRFFSLTFSFYCNDSGTGVIIGGMQGRKANDILQQYKEFTKLAFGLRPRDFVLEVLRIIARAEDIKHIIGVPDRFRYHRHRYYSADNRQDLRLIYDEVWKDRGGSMNGDGMYAIPLTSKRSTSLITPRKRSIHRYRYEFLDQMEEQIALNLQISMPVAGIALD